MRREIQMLFGLYSNCEKQVNPYLQHRQLSNLFVLGASSSPQNASANPTPTILAITDRTADAIVNRYLKNHAPLA